MDKCWHCDEKSNEAIDLVHALWKCRDSSCPCACHGDYDIDDADICAKWEDVYE